MRPWGGGRAPERASERAPERASSRLWRDRGTVSMYTVLFTPSVFLMAGLLVDGGLAIHARERAADIAEQAARAGANEIDLDFLRDTGKPRVNPDAACDSAVDMLAQYDDKLESTACTVTDDDQNVNVTITMKVPLQLLSIVPGFTDFTMTATASAHPETGD